MSPSIYLPGNGPRTYVARVLGGDELNVDYLTSIVDRNMYIKHRHSMRRMLIAALVIGVLLAVPEAASTPAPPEPCGTLDLTSPDTQHCFPADGAIPARHGGVDTSSHHP